MPNGRFYSFTDEELNAYRRRHEELRNRARDTMFAYWGFGMNEEETATEGIDMRSELRKLFNKGVSPRDPIETIGNDEYVCVRSSNIFGGGVNLMVICTERNEYMISDELDAPSAKYLRNKMVGYTERSFEREEFERLLIRTRGRYMHFVFPYNSSDSKLFKRMVT